MSNVAALEAQHVLQTYKRQPVVFVRGDGTRLFIDNRRGVDGWSDGNTSRVGSAGVLAAGWHRIRVDYYERNVPAYLDLRGARPGLPGQAVPGPHPRPDYRPGPPATAPAAPQPDPQRPGPPGRPRHPVVFPSLARQGGGQQVGLALVGGDPSRRIEGEALVAGTDHLPVVGAQHHHDHVIAAGLEDLRHGRGPVIDFGPRKA